MSFTSVGRARARLNRSQHLGRNHEAYCAGKLVATDKVGA